MESIDREQAMGGHSRVPASEACAMDRQTLRDWVLRYDEYGLPGLYDLAQPGPRPFLTAEQEAEVVTWVENGPDLAWCAGAVLIYETGSRIVSVSSSTNAASGTSSITNRAYDRLKSGPLV
jgi:transposase